TPMIASELDEWDVGTWRGRTIAELHAADPGAVGEWVQEPAATPHGGESLLDLLARVGRWLDARAQDRQRIVAVTNGAVIKASLIRALQAPPEAVWRLDVAPLS